MPVLIEELRPHLQAFDFEHLIVFVDPRRGAQVWQWVKREAGKPAACRETAFVAGQSGVARRVEYDDFYMKLFKPFIDEIDHTLADHYGFTDEELDFIINYEIKYRMGRKG